MKKALYFLAGLMAVSAVSCKEEDTCFTNVNDLDRLPMPMFRKKDNTNIADEADRYASKLLPGYNNAIQLHWFGVEGAAGYEIRYAPFLRTGVEADWHDPKRNVKYYTVPAGQLGDTIYNLDYMTEYRFCIRALHPDGNEAHHSQWYGMGNQQQNQDYFGVTTSDRYKTPTLIALREKDYDGFKVLLNLAWNPSQYDQQDADTIMAHFRLTPDQSRFEVTHLIVEPMLSSNPDANVPDQWKRYPISDTDIANGYIKVNGLDMSQQYVCYVIDEDNPYALGDSDKYYNLTSIRTKGDPGADRLIKHRVATEIWLDPEVVYDANSKAVEASWLAAEQKYQACRIDTVITRYNKNPEMAEGQVFLLEGGKAYYLRNGVTVEKGFTLKTDPATLANGHAKVYMGGLAHVINGMQTGNNWNLSKAKEAGDLDVPVQIENVIFEDIDFDCPECNTYCLNRDFGWERTGNYFFNMPASGLGVEYESFQVRNCTMQGLVRGFARIQGNTGRKINKLVVDNCVFFNAGGYENPCGGYRFIHGEQENAADNICKDLQITNNTFYNTLFDRLVSPTKDGFKCASKDFDASVVWNIKVDNNTFINYSTHKATNIFAIKFVPQESYISFKNNLIVLAKDAADNRNMYCGGINIQEVKGSGNLTLDIENNYCLGYDDASSVDDGCFAKAATTSFTKALAADKWTSKLVSGKASDLVVKGGGRATDIFTAPNHPYICTSANDYKWETWHIDPAEIWGKLTYKAGCENTDVYLNNVGDQRWKSADPYNYIP